MVSLKAAVAAVALCGGGQTVLYDFSAEWCGPCRAMAPKVDALAARGYPVRKVDIDQHPDLARRFRVGPIPCFVMVVDGREVDRQVGITGEITLRGKVLPVGGIKAKVLAAHREKISHMVVPRANERDVRKDIPESVARGMQFTFVDRLAQVFNAAMESAAAAREKNEGRRNSSKSDNGAAGTANG